MIKIKRFTQGLLGSNTYVVWDEKTFEENGQKNTVDNITHLLYAIYRSIKQLRYQTSSAYNVFCLRWLLCSLWLM